MKRSAESRLSIRSAYLPLVEKGDAQPKASKFSGTPWLGEDEAWPACPHCKKPRQLFLQLDLDDLPGDERGKRGTGLLQMFYCTEGCDADQAGWEPFSDVGLVRVVRPDGPARTRITDGPIAPFPARRIVGWTAAPDLPNEEECGDLGLELGKTELTRIQQGKLPLSHDKLGGWPYWVQGVEYPSCPSCKTKMELLFQIDSDDHVPYMFGDSGCGHITQCRQHLEIVALGWACC